MKQYFPRGLCSKAETSDYGVSQPLKSPRDPLSPVLPQVKSGLTDEFSGLRHALPPLPPSSLITEITCLILPPSHLSPTPPPPTPQYLQLLELATQAGFSVTGIQLTHLSHSSVAALETLGVDSKVRGHSMLSLDIVLFCVSQGLASGPCLILGLLRDNAVSCFHYILKRFKLLAHHNPSYSTNRQPSSFWFWC